MDRDTVLIVVDATCNEAQLGSLISGIPEQGVHASFLVLGVPEPFPIYAYGSPPYGPVVFPEDWQNRYQTAGQAVSDRAELIERMLQQAAIEGDVSSGFCEIPLLDNIVSEHATLSDLVILPKGFFEEDHLYQQILNAVLFDAPTGVVINCDNVGDILAAKHPFIAWDGSLPAVRAVHRALPILKTAQAITVGVFDPITPGGATGENPGSALATWLSRHGCTVTVQQYPSGGKEIGDCILDRASESGADLVVMGAYGHSRIRQRILGGTTQTMIKQKTHAVLLAH